MTPTAAVPDLLPLLSRGKHRSPRRGACFMELASFLAGERWSDHPSCTHPLLAEVARSVNDRTSDTGRPQLSPLIPSVVGLTPDDPRADARIALTAALAALPVAPFQRQRALAVGVLSCLRHLTSLGDPDAGRLRRRAERVLDEVPDAATWARGFVHRFGLDRDSTPRRFRRSSAPSIVSVAVRGIAEAAPAGQDRLLREVLEGAIEQCRALPGTPGPEAAGTPTVDGARWSQACALSRRGVPTAAGFADR